MSDFTPNKLKFDTSGYMKEFYVCLDIALNRLSRNVILIMQREIRANGNGSNEMKDTAIQQIKELSRTIKGTEVELVVGIDEDSLGGFTDQVFVRTMVVLHGNVASGPLMTKPGQMTWTKHARSMHLSPPINEDGSPRKPKMMPDGFMQYEMVKGFGAKRQMLDNIFNKEVNHVLEDFYDSLYDLMDSIDYSKYITGG